jgi:D-alanyl-D-alanine carboxypeptidase
VTARSGRRVMVVCMINHANANTSAIREAMDALLHWVYENG